MLTQHISIHSLAPGYVFLFRSFLMRAMVIFVIESCEKRDSISVGLTISKCGQSLVPCCFVNKLSPSVSI